MLNKQLSIYQLIQAQTEINAEKIAILGVNRKPLTYNRLQQQIKQVGNTLKMMGVERNDRVAIALPNGPEMAVAFLAVSSYATAAPLNPNYRAKEFEFYLEDLQAKALIIQPGVAEDAIIVAEKLGIPLVQLSPILEEEAGKFTLIFTISGSETIAKNGVTKFTERSRSELSNSNCPNLTPNRTFSYDKTVAKDGFAEEEDIALILHTSGTTSRPKMVLLSHKNLCVSAVERKFHPVK